MVRLGRRQFAVLFAIDLPGETAIGAGMFGLLTAFSVGMFRRQRENDERRDEITRQAVEFSTDQAARAQTEREAALARERAAVDTADRLRAELEEARRGR